MGRRGVLDGCSVVTLPEPDKTSAEDADRHRQRWRLTLGSAATDHLGELDAKAAAMDDALAFLERDGSPDGTGALTIPEWVNQVHELFPRSVAEKIMEDAVNRHKLTEVVTNAETLAVATPSTSLLKAILATKHLMNPDVLDMARGIIDKVVRELLRSMARPVTNPFTGRRDPRRRSRQQVAANFDARGTVRANLKHVNPDTRRLVIREPLFNTRIRLQQDRWQVVVLVDQSGSMADSVIHAAITAAIFTGISAMRTHLVAFDTSVVDLTSEAADPVEVLMKVQLGGGTDINQAMRYGGQLLDNPRRSILVLISDFYEGGDEQELLATTRRFVEDGVKVLCLGALDASGRSQHCLRTAQLLAATGADVAVMTPDQLAAWVAEVIT